MEAVCVSIREFGFQQPLVVDKDGVLIVGHTRRLAALKLGLTEVPVVIADLPPEKARAYRIADNQTATIADWDTRNCPSNCLRWKKRNFDLALLGFSAEELAKLMGQEVDEGNCDPDDVPEPPDEAVTQPGDLWVLGRHRLLCGDSSKPEDVDRLLAGAPIHLVNSDRRYNVKVEPRSNNAIAAGLSSFSGPSIIKASTCPVIQASLNRRQAPRKRPTAGQRLRFGRSVRCITRRMVRELQPCAPTRTFVLHLGRLCELRQLSTVPKEA